MMSEGQICLYYREEPEKDRFFKGDRFIRPIVRKLIRKKRISGIKKVFLNLCKGFDLLNVNYIVNKPFSKLKPKDKVVILGRGRYALTGYHHSNPIIAGISLMTHPSEWPDLCTEYPIAKYLQHSEWANNVYIPYYGSGICETWPTGIDTEKWKPAATKKTIDFLIYNKIYWEVDHTTKTLVNPILNYLTSNGYSFVEIKYGHYTEKEYHHLLTKCKAMIFLAGHESQGIACCEAMSMDVPVLAWDIKLCMDPERFKWGQPVIPATSVPFFDHTCGDRFKDIETFQGIFDLFYSNVLSGYYNPRDYILKNLTLKKSAERMLEIIKSVY